MNGTNKEVKSENTAEAGKCKKRKPLDSRVVLFVAGVFLLLEIFFRVGGVSLSKDIAHLKSFPSVANQLANFDTDKGTRILFLGNSLTRHGVDQTAFAEVVENEVGVKIQSVKMNPDNTDLSDWFYAYRTFFANENITPDVVIVGFEGVHLRDASSRHPDRLAQYYCNWSDFPELCKYDLKTTEEKIHFAFCKYSAAFGNRERIQKKVYDKLIPNYRAGTELINERRNRISQRKAAEKTGIKEPEKPTFKRLEQFLSIAKKQGTTVILAAMPVPESYQFDAEFLDVVQKSDATLIDCRTVEEITLPMFFDGLHMDEQAAKIYSSDLAKKIVPQLKSLTNR